LHTELPHSWFSPAAGHHYGLVGANKANLGRRVIVLYTLNANAKKPKYHILPNQNVLKKIDAALSPVWAFNLHESLWQLRVFFENSQLDVQLNGGEFEVHWTSHFACKSLEIVLAFEK